MTTRYSFTGRERDDLSGLMYYRARFYDPRLGRFISEDPIGFGGGDINLYGYVWNDPLHYVDPMGLDSWGNDLADWLEDRFNTATGVWVRSSHSFQSAKPGAADDVFWSDARRSELVKDRIRNRIRYLR